MKRVGEEVGGTGYGRPRIFQRRWCVGLPLRAPRPRNGKDLTGSFSDTEVVI